MSGFENMRSTVNQFLHPSIDPHDTYDPTFNGIGTHHKRRVPGYGSTPASGAGTARNTPTPNATSKTAAVLSKNSGMALNSSAMGGGGGAQQQQERGLFTNMADTTDKWLTHRGKRPDPRGPRHNDSVLRQDEAMVEPFNVKGNLNEVRFGKGFNRRSHSAIDVERPRLEDESRRTAAAEERQIQIRQRHADRERPLNPLTWAPTSTAIAYDTETSRRKNYAQFNHTAHTLSSAAATTTTAATASGEATAATTTTASVTSATAKVQPPLYPSTSSDKVQSKRTFHDKYETKVGPPATGNTIANIVTPYANVSAALERMGANTIVAEAMSSSKGGSNTINPIVMKDLSPFAERLLRRQHEGMLRPKEWGVAQQLKCGDGYALPEIAPTGEGRVARKQIRQQTVADTRPW